MSHIPNGIPTISYCRILPTVGAFGQGDIVNDGNAIVVLEPGQPSSRFEVAQVIEKNFDDEEACEMTFGNKAGAGLGAVLNPVSAFVNDCANVVIFLVGSRNTRKWHFLKRIFLPFVANEILANLSERSQTAQNNLYKAQLTISAMEIQDEIVTDLLRPANRGLSILTNIEEGVIVQGLHRETVIDEMALRRLLIESCDNRGIQNLPVGGNIDTSTGIFEFRLYQSEAVNMNMNNLNNPPAFQTRECHSRLIIVDLPAVDPLLSTFNSSSSEEMRLFAGTTLHKSLFTFLEVSKKLNNPFRAQLAPFRSSKLTHYLSELIGGNAMVVSFGNIISGEPTITKITLELLSYLNSAVHYPLSGREISDTVQGLLTKYRSMLIYSQNEILLNSQTVSDTQQQTKDLHNQILTLQKELATALIDKNTAVDDRMKIVEILELMKKKYQTVLDEKLHQSELLSEKEEENILLAKTILEKNLEMSLLKEDYDKQLFEKQQEILKLSTLLENKEKENSNLLNEKNILLKEMEFNKEVLTEKNNEINLLKLETMNKGKEINELKEKNIEISAELLTLVNTRDVLTKENNDLKLDKEGYLSKKQELLDTVRSLEVENKKLMEKLLLKDDELLTMKKTNQIDFLKDQGKTKKENKRRSKDENDENEGEDLELKSTLGGGNEIAKRMIQAMRLSVEEKKEKLLLKQLYEWETKYNRLLYDSQQQKSFADTVNRELDELREKYSLQLKENITNSNKTNNNNNSAETNPVNQALTTLLSHYERIIDSLHQKNDGLHTTNQELIGHYRELYDHYHTMTDNLEEMTHLFQDYSQLTARTDGGKQQQSSNKANEKKILIETKLKMIIDNAMKEQYQLSQEKLAAEEKWLNDVLTEDKLSQTNATEEMKKQQIEEKEKIAAIINTYQRNLQVSEQKNVKLQQENINLQIKINQLLAKPQQLSPGKGGGVGELSIPEPSTPQHLKESRPETTTATQQPPQTKKQQQQEEEKNALYETLTLEIRELKNLILQQESNPLNNNSKEKDNNKSRRPSSQLIEVLKDVMSGKNSAGKLTPQPPPLSAVAKEAGIPSGRSTAKSIKSSGGGGLGSNNNKEEEGMPGEGEKNDFLSLPVIPSAKELLKDPFPSQPTQQQLLETIELRKQLMEAEQKIVQLQQQQQQTQLQQDQNHFRRQLVEAEQKIVQYQSKQMSMEEELKAYQNYMRDAIPQYQKQIKALQQRLKQQQGQQPPQSQLGAQSPVPEVKEPLKLPLLKLPENK
jgi:FtsZ-binding cell division protein ZapB